MAFIAKGMVIVVILCVFLIIAGALVLSAICGGLAGLWDHFFNGSHTDDID